MHCLDMLYINAVHISLALSRRSELQHFKHGKAIKRHNAIMFNFYLELLHKIRKTYFVPHLLHICT